MARARPTEALNELTVFSRRGGGVGTIYSIQARDANKRAVEPVMTNVRCGNDKDSAPATSGGRVSSTAERPS